MPKEVTTVKSPVVAAPAPVAQKAKARNLRVLHTRVDDFPKGHVLAVEHLPPGADIERLIKLGAVEYVDEPAAEVPIGPAAIAKTATEQAAKAEEAKSDEKPADVSSEPTPAV